MKILVTGVHGFVGTNLVETLKNDHVIYGLDVFSQKNDGIENTFHWIALDELTGMELSAIVHLDNFSHNSKSKTAPYVPLEQRVEYTQKIFDYFLASDAKKFIFLSSVKAVTDKVEGNVLTEEAVPSPEGSYGKNKLASESYILSKQAEWEAKGKEVYIVRPCVIHGPDCKGSLPLLYNVVRKGIPWPLGDFDNKLSFTYIDNLCFVLKSLLTQPVASGIYHMADDEPIAINRLITIIWEAVGKKPRIWHFSKETMDRLAKLGDFLHLPLNTRRLLKLTQTYVVSNAKIKAALGIEKMPVSVQKGLMLTVKSFRDA